MFIFSNNKTLTKVINTIAQIDEIKELIVNPNKIVIRVEDMNRLGSTEFVDDMILIRCNDRWIKQISNGVCGNSFIWHFIEVVVHELVHSKQMLTGRLTLEDADFKKPYDDRWFEKEAYEITDRLMRDLFDELR